MAERFRVDNLMRRGLRGGEGVDKKEEEKRWEPNFFFFYGTLTDPMFLRELLGLERVPILTEMRVEGFRIGLWGQFPAMVKVDGEAEGVRRGKGTGEGKEEKDIKGNSKEEDKDEEGVGKIKVKIEEGSLVKEEDNNESPVRPTDNEKREGESYVEGMMYVVEKEDHLKILQEYETSVYKLEEVRIWCGRWKMRGKAFVWKGDEGELEEVGDEGGVWRAGKGRWRTR
jgi:hypothetical protein